MNDKTLHFSEFEHSVMPWIGKTAKLMSIFMREHFVALGFDLTKEQYVLLKILNQQDGVIQKELAFITERNKSSLARLMHTMEKKNYLMRIPAKQDKRINRVYITPYGQETFKKVQPYIQQWIEAAQAGLSEKEVNAAIRILRTIHDNINRHCSE